MRNVKPLRVLTVTAAVAIALAAASPLTATASTLKAPGAQAEIYYVVGYLGDAELPTIQTDAKPVKSGTLAPDYAAGTIALCNAGFGDVSVSNYTTSKFGKIDLFCGDSASGYVHIRSTHESDWANIIAKYPIGGSWDDLMEYHIKTALPTPSGGLPKDVGSGKWCYSAPLQIRNSSGTVVKTYYPRTIVSGSNHKVITSYPTSTPGCA